MESPAEVDVRCSLIVFRDGSVLLVHRARDGADDWVLPGGTPDPGESMAACARRETLEETGLQAEPGRVAFVAETLAPGAGRRVVDLVFLAVAPAHGEPEPMEEDLEARFVSLSVLPGLVLRPPLAARRVPACTARPRTGAHRRLPRQPVAARRRWRLPGARRGAGRSPAVGQS